MKQCLKGEENYSDQDFGAVGERGQHCPELWIFYQLNGLFYRHCNICTAVSHLGPTWNLSYVGLSEILEWGQLYLSMFQAISHLGPTWNYIIWAFLGFESTKTYGGTHLLFEHWECANIALPFFVCFLDVKVPSSSGVTK